MGTNLKKSFKSAKQERRVLVSPSLANAKRYLQKNDISEVAHECGIGVSQASKVMSGKSTNWDFVKKIIERAERNKALQERAQSI